MMSGGSNQCCADEAPALSVHTQLIKHDRLPTSSASLEARIPVLRKMLGLIETSAANRE